MSVVNDFQSLAFCMLVPDGILTQAHAYLGVLIQHFYKLNDL